MPASSARFRLRLLGELDGVGRVRVLVGLRFVLFRRRREDVGQPRLARQDRGDGEAEDEERDDKRPNKRRKIHDGLGGRCEHAHAIRRADERSQGLISQDAVREEDRSVWRRVEVANDLAASRIEVRGFDERERERVGRWNVGDVELKAERHDGRGLTAWQSASWCSPGAESEIAVAPLSP